MLRNNPEYKRLKVGGHGALSSASYWLGREHLLLVVIASYVEKYHRFRYADIQGLVIRKTRTHYIWGFIFAALALGAFLAAFDTLRGQSLDALSSGAVAGFSALVFFGAVMVGSMILNAIWGPTCTCHLRTALQSLPLPQIRRWKKAQSLVREMTPLIIGAQGGEKMNREDSVEPVG